MQEGCRRQWCLQLLLLLLFHHSIGVMVVTAQQTPPHIIFIVADDLGWNDIGFHGSLQVQTPNIDALAYSGVILNNYYVHPICTPSRSAIMSGLHPIHTGLNHGTIGGAQPYGLPLNITTLPQHLRGLGYSAHHVGKWHLGFYKKEFTPTYRGFESHLGYWSGRVDYYDHTADEADERWGYDFRRNMDVAHDAYGEYATDIFTREAVEKINSHNSSTPLFLYLAHLAVHSANLYAPLQAPEETVKKFNYIQDEDRRIFAGMLSKLDDSVGEVMQALDQKGMLDNSIIIFTTDNGGPAAGFNSNAASNWPLRGVKATLWEGGVRGAGFVWSPIITQSPGVVSDKLMCIDDWLPSLYAAAGGNTSSLPPMDGVNMWPTISSGAASARTQLLHNIDPVFNGTALRMGDWKLLNNGSAYEVHWDRWFGPSSRNCSPPECLELPELVTNIRQSPAGIIILERDADALNNLEHSRQQAMVNCSTTPSVPRFFCRSSHHCLFHIPTDPCELTDLSSEHPDIVLQMLKLLNEYKKSAVPIANQPDDPRADPKYWDYNWNNWLDYPPPAGVNFTEDTSDRHKKGEAPYKKLFDFFKPRTGKPVCD
uniref:Arylsulfatase B-like n=1 Tax=Hirondellea gigas TaxID=1518452 RepID=A0A2P2I865_9CRUS